MEEISAVSWRAPNNNPKPTKIVRWAKNLWARYPDPWRPPSGVRVRVTDDVLPDIVSNLVLIPINIYYKAGPADFETWTGWVHRITKEKLLGNHRPTVEMAGQAYSLLVKAVHDSTLNR
jgi:hypothetical protein